MRNHYYRSLLFCVPLLVTGCSDVNPPTIPYPGIATTGITSTSVSLFWNKATDTITDTSALRYRIYLSAQNPAYQSFDTLAEVEAGTLVQELTDASSYTISTGISAGNAYYLNIVVLDDKNNRALYNSLGEYFHANLISYYPFNGSWNDATVTANHLLVNPVDPPITTSPAVTFDRFGYPNSAYSFTPATAPTTPQCLQSTTNVGISGNASRSVSFWVQSFNTQVTPSAPFAWGDGSVDGANFGVYESGLGVNWTVWLGGTATVVTTALATSDWEHWVIGYDSAFNLVYTYKNGVVVTNGIAATANTTDTLLYVGCGLIAGVISNPYMGNIDDVRVFNQLLGSADVARLYTYTRP